MDKIKFRATHYGPVYKDKKFVKDKHDTSIIWVVSVDDTGSDIWFSGYLKNTEDFKEGQEIEFDVLDSYFMEHSNGGRGNSQRYKSVDAYYSDPEVIKKIQYIKAPSGPLSDDPSEEEIRASPLGRRLFSKGDPENIDHVIEFRNRDHLETFSGSSYAHSNLDISKRVTVILSNSLAVINNPRFHITEETEVYPTAKDAIEAQELHEDMFGNRYFPVIVFPVKTTDYADIMDLLYSFKNSSDILEYGGYYIVGVRSKPDEIDTLGEIYEKGGRVLKDQVWDWS